MMATLKLMCGWRMKQFGFHRIKWRYYLVKQEPPSPNIFRMYSMKASWTREWYIGNSDTPLNMAQFLEKRRRNPLSITIWMSSFQLVTGLNQTRVHNSGSGQPSA